jgi:hypothetical protein
MILYVTMYITKGDTMIYKEYDTELQIFTIALSTGGEIKVDMNDEYLIYNFNIDIELEFSNDAAKDICFIVNDVCYTAQQIIQWCQYNHDSIHQEHEDEQREDLLEAAFLSCPQMTGRV